MDKLSNFIASATLKIAKLRKDRDLLTGEIARLELLEETDTWSYRLKKRKLENLTGELVGISLDYALAKDIAALN